MTHLQVDPPSYLNTPPPGGTLPARRKSGIESIPTDEFITWSDDASVPQLPAHLGVLRLYRKLRMHDRLNGRRALELADPVTSRSAVLHSRPRGGERREPLL